MTVGQPNSLMMSFFMVGAFGGFLFLLIRFGMLPGLFWAVFMWAGEDVVLTADPSAWYAGRSLTVVLVLAALAGYGFYISLAGRPLVGDRLLKGQDAR